MNKFWIILGHTYTTRIKSKTFIITTLITLILIFALTNIKTIIDVFSDGEADQIAVIDETNELYKPLTENMKQTSEEIELTLYDGTEEEAKQAVEEEDYTALIVLTMNENKLPKATYYANSISQSSLQTTLEQQLQQLKAMYATEQAGVDPVALAMINEPVTFDTVALDKSVKTEEELNQARGIVYIMLFLLYITVIMYGNMIATDVATEKSSRVMEILISSAPPVTHMFAKIFGVALVGLTQIALFLGSGYALISAKDEATQELFAQFGIGSASMSIYIYAIVFFILGYLLYATLAAMLGSLVSRIEDAQQLTMPMIFLIMIAFIIAMSGLATPEAGFIKVTSFIPFFTPMIMFLRVGMLDVPIWEVALSIGLLIGTIIILALLGAKVYRGGVLMYGRSSSLKDFKKALALSKKEK
ncbi:ABC transporter permease [Virgibacillus pantothenticus]|uniref:ABC transporter permease n=1 Tax=Virgibacillus pantothenticus TaxID=1473 RepID=UPI001C21B321|nr:ABC transporter permease [Virgibacillus pantothenticus]MBU8566893.1 ABC transporter permease [Virgibacillus pantothenticus]MBU8600414.1 ABC transporter permease [Virgibacillus pantothenticus]MBU8635190.1 ABC transporter permease [Virgibacillus pantothenticus]MBU8642612.1 ABC transporter permease [Virgibacillus pantothenticus]MBU8646700.1 ABC transporter permease [Virgibacillus pantothenticus]